MPLEGLRALLCELPDDALELERPLVPVHRAGERDALRWTAHRSRRRRGRLGEAARAAGRACVSDRSPGKSRRCWRRMNSDGSSIACAAARRRAATARRSSWKPAGSAQLAARQRAQRAGSVEKTQKQTARFLEEVRSRAEEREVVCREAEGQAALLCGEGKGERQVHQALEVQVAGADPARSLLQDRQGRGIEQRWQGAVGRPLARQRTRYASPPELAAPATGQPLNERHRLRGRPLLEADEELDRRAAAAPLESERAGPRALPSARRSGQARWSRQARNAAPVARRAGDRASGRRGRAAPPRASSRAARARRAKRAPAIVPA